MVCFWLVFVYQCMDRTERTVEVAAVLLPGGHNVQM